MVVLSAFRSWVRPVIPALRRTSFAIITLVPRLSSPRRTSQTETAEPGDDGRICTPPPSRRTAAEGQLLASLQDAQPGPESWSLVTTPSTPSAFLATLPQ